MARTWDHYGNRYCNPDDNRNHHCNDNNCHYPDDDYGHHGHTHDNDRVHGDGDPH